jgi:hypothetical protein
MQTLNPTDFAALLATAKPGHSFSSEMMHALLDGKKTATRRPIKGVEPEWEPLKAADGSGEYKFLSNPAQGIRLARTSWIKPRYRPGGVYYARETFQTILSVELSSKLECGEIDECGIQYLVDHKTGVGLRASYPSTDGIQEIYNMATERTSCACKPSIHFPRWAARCIYQIHNVYPQRIQDLTPEQIVAEGVPSGLLSDWRDLIVRIYGAEYYDSDPWTFAHEFTLLAVREEGR